MDLSNYKFQSAFVRKHFNSGVTKGVAKGKAEAVLAVLKARGMRVSAEQRARVRSCTDAAILDGWIRLAATASSTDEVLRVRRARS